MPTPTTETPRGDRLGADFVNLGESPGFHTDPETLNEQLTALVNRRKLEIIYRKPDGRPDENRTICPVKLLLFKSELYFVCISSRNTAHNYYLKLSRILSARCTSEKFTISADQLQKIERRLSTSFGILDEDSPKPEKVIVWFPSYFDLILSERRFHPTQRVTPDTEDNCLLEMNVPVDTDLVQWILGWADKALVLRPDGLRKKLLETGRFLVAQYSKE